MTAPLSDPAQTHHWREWYGLQRWKKRAHHQLRTEPLCAQCLAQGRVTPATIADHNPPHQGVWNDFRLGPLQSLCADCHKRKWADDRHGYHSDIGDDGFPLDPRHPFNRKRTSDGGPAAGELRERQPGPPSASLSHRRTPPQPLVGYPDDSPKQPGYVRAFNRVREQT
jgi:5-methylcytosine-specific restriction protein A